MEQQPEPLYRAKDTERCPKVGQLFGFVGQRAFGSGIGLLERGAERFGPTMAKKKKVPKQNFDWHLTLEQIGRELRKIYRRPEQLSRRLRAAMSRLERKSR